MLLVPGENTERRRKDVRFSAQRVQLVLQVRRGLAGGRAARDVGFDPRHGRCLHLSSLSRALAQLGRRRRIRHEAIQAWIEKVSGRARRSHCPYSRKRPTYMPKTSPLLTVVRGVAPTRFSCLMWT